MTASSAIFGRNPSAVHINVGSKVGNTTARLFVLERASLQPDHVTNHGPERPVEGGYHGERVWERRGTAGGVW
jgi:hypothetical protein